MAVTTKNLEDALAGAGVEPELAASIAVAMQPFIESDGVSQAESVSEERSDSDDVRLARLEQKVDDLRDLMMVGLQSVDRRFDDMEKRIDHRFEGVDHRFEGVDRRFEEVDRRFGDVDRRFEEAEKREDRRFEAVDRRFDDLNKRLDRERMERWAFVVAVGGSITAALLRLFGAI